MMQLAKPVVLLALLLSFSGLNGQTYQERHRHPSSFWKQNFNYLVHPSFIYSAQVSNFYNPSIETRIKDGTILKEYSDSYILRWTGYPLIIDFGVNTTRFSVPAAEETSKRYLINYATEFSGALCLPWHQDLSKHIAPFIGVGYFIGSFKNELEKVDTSAPFWKFGIMMSVFEGDLNDGLAILNIEYKQAFDTSNPSSFSQVSVGLGVRGEALYLPLMALISLYF